MADGTAIEWTDATWNPLRARRLRWANGERRPIQQVIAGQTKQVVGWHCEHVSEGCRNCYAEGINRRLGTRLDFKPGHRSDIEVFLDEKMLTQPLRWKRPRMIFVCSMTDLFADFVKDEWIDRMFAVMALCPQHRFQVLTKRAARMREYMASAHERIAESAMTEAPQGRDIRDVGILWGPREQPPVSFEHWPLPNVWLGVSAEDQANADARIPDLLATPAAMRFVSLEPLLGAIDLTNLGGKGSAKSFGAHGFSAMWKDNGIGRAWLDWVIVGGESGPHARPMHPDWARSLRDQCQAAGVPYFFKQWGAWRPHLDDYPRNSERAGIIYPSGRFVTRCLGDPLREGADMFMAGKKRAGRLLDGIEWNGMPA